MQNPCEDHRQSQELYHDYHRFVLHVLSSTLTSGNCLNLLNKSSSMLCSNEIALIFVSSFLVEARTSLSFFFDMTISSLLYAAMNLYLEFRSSIYHIYCWFFYLIFIPVTVLRVISIFF